MFDEKNFVLNIHMIYDELGASYYNNKNIIDNVYSYTKDFVLYENKIKNIGSLIFL